ncbi:hypothetical protein Tco_1155164 [Tanacetum coccineum]
MECEDEKRRGKLDRRDGKINVELQSKGGFGMRYLGLKMWLDQELEEESLCEGKIRLEGLKIKNEDDEDKDEIKGLIWVNNHIANKKGKSKNGEVNK